jgi:hypothetical protein
MAGPLALDRDAIAAACERYGVVRLVVWAMWATDPATGTFWERPTNRGCADD